MDYGMVWEVKIHCLDPVCERTIEPIVCFDPEQAILIAREKATKIFGKQGEGWSHIDVYMKNMT